MVLSTFSTFFLVLSLAVAAWSAGAAEHPPLFRHEASRMSMACLYAIEAYGRDAQALPRIVEQAFDEVDRIDRLMSHYKADSELSRVNRDAAQHPVIVGPELFSFISEAMRYSRESEGAFDITVGPLMKAWGFFRGEGRLPADDALASVRRNVGGNHVRLDPGSRSIAFDRHGVELDLGGIAKGYAVDRAVGILRNGRVSAALVSAGGSTIYGMGAPPDREVWEVQIADPTGADRVAKSVRLKDRALSVAGSSEKSFEAGGVTYSHIMDPRSGRPVQGMLSVAVLTGTGTAGDALDDALFVMGVERSRAYLNRLPETEAFFFLPDKDRRWKMIHLL
jgi:FAD:protein FMN transferase